MGLKTDRNRRIRQGEEMGNENKNWDGQCGNLEQRKFPEI